MSTTLTTEQQSAIDRTAAYVREKFMGEGSGHDWWHLWRVWQNAKRIGAGESVDMFVVELGALLHDIADWKFHGGDTTAGPRAATAWLRSIGVDDRVTIHICEIIEHISFKGAGVATPMATREGCVVQDADRLDAIGAIGIARCFAYGGHKNRPLYDPTVSPVAHQNFAAYAATDGTSLNHFYEKLLLVKDRMNTESGRGLAEERHIVVENFLQRFSVFRT